MNPTDSPAPIDDFGTNAPKPKLFLDVDGVLLGHPSAGESTYQLANHALVFLRFALAQYDVAWATTHCRNGDPTHVVDYIADHSAQDERERVIGHVREIRATSFNVCKTEMLPTDMRHPWIWMDDAPLAFELEQLRQRGQIDRWLEVNTMKRPNDLLRAIEVLRAAHSG